MYGVDIETVQLTFRSSRYGRKRLSRFVLDYDDWPESVARWLWPAVVQYEKRTSLSPANLTEWDSLKHALPGLALVLSWEGFTSIPIAELEVEDVRDLFIDIDSTFNSEWGLDRGVLRSSRARAFILDYLLELRPDGTLLRVKGAFAPQSRANYQPRPLISDQVKRAPGTKPEAPIGALPHVNVSDLKAQTKKRLISDLDQIADACSLELRMYFQACETLHLIRSGPVDSSSEASALEKIGLARSRTCAALVTAPSSQRSRKRGTTKEVVESLSPKERHALIAHYLRLDNLPDAPSICEGYEGSRFLAADLSKMIGVERDAFLRCARYQYYPHQTVLTAAIVLIQIATAWNVGSVMELASRGIRALGRGQYLLQSTKPKTKDDTPPVLLEGDDTPAVQAVRFALGRLQALKDRGWATPEEAQLWLSPRSNHDSSRGLQVSNLSKGLQTLRAKYHLPRFTFEQLRVQKLTVVSLERGPIAAAETAGHSTFGTIGGYIDHLLTRGVNSSGNLEFQRRWEKEVLARVLRKKPDHPLVPIGDGTSCVAPAEPPDEAWLRAGTCDGSRCHVGEGCPNRVLVIDPARIQEVVLTKKYYDTNWQRLHASNVQAFSAIHMPRLEFNTYLYAYLKKGPYRHMLNG
jgi:hypothetical protein